MTRPTRALLPCLAVLFLACTPAPTGPPTPAVTELRDLGVTDVIDVAWPVPDTLVISKPGPAYLGRGEIGTVSVEAPDVVTLPDVPADCGWISSMVPLPAQDGFTFLRTCEDGAALRLELWSSDLAGEQTSRLAEIDFLTTQYASAGDGWLGSYSDGLCAWVAFAGGTTPPDGWPIVVDDQGERFTVDEPRDAEPCGAMAKALDLAPSGRYAFLASPEAAGVGGFDRFDVEWSVYLSDAPPASRPILRGLVLPTALFWRPGADTIGVTGTLDGVRGLWLVDPDGEPTLVFEGDVFSFGWSPDGRQAALMLGPSPTRLVIIDVP